MTKLHDDGEYRIIIQNLSKAAKENDYEQHIKAKAAQIDYHRHHEEIHSEFREDRKDNDR